MALNMDNGNAYVADTQSPEGADAWKEQLTGHNRTALTVAGMSDQEEGESIVHLLSYIGVLKTLAAMHCMKAAV